MRLSIPGDYTYLSMPLPVASDYTSQIPDGYNIDSIRRRFPGLNSNTISMNNGAGSVVLGSAIDA